MVGVARWAALGTTAEIAVLPEGCLPAVRRLVETELARCDAACSRFRSDSEVMQLPDDGRPHAVSPWLEQAVAVALRVARATDGAVDPTLRGSLVGAGYDADFARLADSGPPCFTRAGGWDGVKLDALGGTVALQPGCLLDLGASAKALAADRSAASALDVPGVTGVLVNLGGDIAVGGAPPSGGWTVRLADDHRTVEGPAITIHSGGIATSSTVVRRWTRGGVSLHHILDPATGCPATGPWRTVTVAAASCVDANAGSTAAIVKGLAAIAWLRGQGLPARLVRTDGSVEVVNGFPSAPVVIRGE